MRDNQPDLPRWPPRAAPNGSIKPLLEAQESSTQVQVRRQGDWKTGRRVTERQGDRETGRQRDREMGDREKERQMGDRETKRQRDRETGREMWLHRLLWAERSVTDKQLPVPVPPTGRYCITKKRKILVQNLLGGTVTGPGTYW